MSTTPTPTPPSPPPFGPGDDTRGEREPGTNDLLVSATMRYGGLAPDAPLIKHRVPAFHALLYHKACAVLKVEDLVDYNAATNPNPVPTDADVARLVGLIQTIETCITPDKPPTPPTVVTAPAFNLS